MSVDETLQLSPPQKKVLDYAMTYIARAVGFSFFSILAGGGVLLLITRLVVDFIKDTPMSDPNLFFVSVAFVVIGFFVGLIFYIVLSLLSKSARYDLLETPLQRGSGIIEHIDFPKAENFGGSTVLKLKLNLPSGPSSEGFLRVHNTGSIKYQKGQQIELLFDQRERAFMPVSCPEGFDPGKVLSKN